jgi:ParB family chromosome partitioning protein
MSTRKKNMPYTSMLRGVSTLLGDTSEELASVSDPGELSSLAIEIIKLPHHQPRRYFDPEKLHQLTESIKVHGILEPLLVRSLDDGKHELVAGERRYRAAQAAGLTEVPVIVKHFTDREAWQVALVENLQREDLNPLEETEGMLSLLSLRLEIGTEDVIQRLYRMQNELKGKVTQNVLGSSEGTLIQTVFSEVGSIGWESFVSSRLPLLRMPKEILEAVQQGKIAYTKAQIISRIKDDDKRSVILQDAIAKSWSLMEIKKAISSSDSEQTTAEKITPSGRITQVMKLLQQAKVWQDPKKLKRLEKLLLDLEALTESQET